MESRLSVLEEKKTGGRKMKIVNPTAATVFKCRKCGKNFSTAVKRDRCLECKPITGIELKKLMNYDGCHVAVKYADRPIMGVC
jgi:predicted Zn-ribbon and HTH transcriptional regulator